MGSDTGETDPDIVFKSARNKDVLTVKTSTIKALAGFLISVGGVVGYQNYSRPVSEGIPAAHLQADHDQIITTASDVRALKDSLLMIANRLEKIEDKSEEALSLTKRIYYGSRRGDVELPAPSPK